MSQEGHQQIPTDLTYVAQSNFLNFYSETFLKGECHPQDDDRMLLQLFKEGDPPTLANNSRHGTQQQHQQQQQQQQQQQEQASSWMGNSSGYAPHNPYG